MILQLLNILGGVLLCAAFIRNTLESPKVDAAFAKVAKYDAWVGLAAFIFGVVGLVQRVGLLFIFSGASYPQVFPAIAVGLILGWPLIQRFTFLQKVHQLLAPYQVWVGFVAILCGLGSLFLGCVYPVCFAL